MLTLGAAAVSEFALVAAALGVSRPDFLQDRRQAVAGAGDLGADNQGKVTCDE